MKFEMRPSDLTENERINEGGFQNAPIFDEAGKNTKVDSSFDDHHLFKNSIVALLPFCEI